MGLFKKDKGDKSAPHGLRGAFAEIREAERLMEGIQQGGVGAAEQFAAADTPIDPANAVAARAKVIAYEGHDAVETQGVTRSAFREHASYIVEIHPETEPAFRTEVKGWVYSNLRPQVDEVVNVRYERGTQRAVLDLGGDPRYDYDQHVAARQADAAATRDQLLNAPVSQDPLP